MFTMNMEFNSQKDKRLGLYISPATKSTEGDLGSGPNSQ